MSTLPFNITNPGIWIDGVLTTVEREYVTALVLAGDTASEDDVLTWKSGAPSWEANAGGGGYTDLTEFVDQTAWRVFYSNGSGDVVELALGADGTFLKSNGTTSAPTFDTPSGSGDMLASVYDPANGAEQVAFASELHDPVTVSDSSEIDFTLTGQQISASIVAGSIDESKLDASVNASLDLADSAVQDLSDLGITASAAELNILDGVTASTAELNILDGATLTVTELNYVDGVTSAIQTQLDGKQPLDTQLTDLAGLSYSSNALKVIRVNAGETGFELATPSGGGDVTKVGTPANNQIGVWTGDGTIEGDSNLTWDTSGNLVVARTDNGATGPNIVLYLASASPADNDLVGSISFFGNDDMGELTFYGGISMYSNDVSDTTEGGELIVSIADGNGSTSNVIDAYAGSSGANLYVGGTTFGGQFYIDATETGGFVNNSGTGILFDESISPKLQLNSSDGIVGTVSLDAGSVGPTFELYHDSATPAAADMVGKLSFQGNDGAGNKQEYALIQGVISDATSTSEDGILKFGVVTAGTVANKLELTGASLYPTTNDGLALGSTTNQFSDLFLAEGGVINWDNGDVTMTQTGNELAIAGGVLKVGGLDVGIRTVAIQISGAGSGDSALTTGDAKATFAIDTTLNGMNLVSAKAYVTTVSSSGTPLFQVRRSRRSSATARSEVDMLSTGVSIDASEFESADATTAVSINTSNDDVQTGDILLIDCDTAGTGTKGATILLTFQLP